MWLIVPAASCSPLFMQALSESKVESTVSSQIIIAELRLLSQRERDKCSGIGGDRILAAFAGYFLAAR